jgi:hypothetical protein
VLFQFFFDTQCFFGKGALWFSHGIAGGLSFIGIVLIRHDRLFLQPFVIKILAV